MEAAAEVKALTNDMQCVSSLSHDYRRVIVVLHVLKVSHVYLQGYQGEPG